MMDIDDLRVIQDNQFIDEDEEEEEEQYDYEDYCYDFCKEKSS